MLAYNPVQKNDPKSRQVDAQKTVRIEGGLYRMGHNGEGFCYDLEMPEHKTYLARIFDRCISCNMWTV